MRGIFVGLAFWLVATMGFAAEKAQNPWDPNYVVSEETARLIESAMPDKPFATPARPRKLLIFGRMPTHPMSVACCFKAIEAMGRKTGAFETVASGDPLVFLPENLKQFDAVLMNNTHESHPMLPINFDKLSEEQKAAAKEREPLLQKSLLNFVAGGKGVAGVHAAVATRWKEYLDMMGGPFGSHITDQVWVKPNEPAHPICVPLNGQSFQVLDEIYISTNPAFRKGLHVLLSLDLERTPGPRWRSDGDYVISWIRPYHKGRVFYCSLGHNASSYYNPHVLRHYLAGIQFALGDLEADATVQIRNPTSDIRNAEPPIGYITFIPLEVAEDREARHKRIAQRRAEPAVIVHRGAFAFAPENTIEAYAAAMDYGADGCEIDIRRTADGVLVMFHDDGLDRMTDAMGPLNQHTYAELLALDFRPVYAAKPGTRIPTLAAVLELARQHAMLLHLDVKEPGLEEEIARLLDTADMWDHVVEINEANAAALRKNPKYRRLAYKAFGLQGGRLDMDPEKVKAALVRPGNMIMVDDPRVAARELKREKLPASLPDNLRAPLPLNLALAVTPQRDPNSLSPTAYLLALANRIDSRSLDELGKVLASDLAERGDLEGDTARQQQRTRRILERAWAAQKIGQLGEKSPRAVKLLEELVAHRSLHRDWAYNGLDGAIAARALAALGATESAPFLIQTFRAVDPELEKLVKPPAEYPYAWADYRMKREIISVLGELPCEPSKKFLSECVAMNEATAGEFSMPQFEEATQALLRQKLVTEELQGLLRSTNTAVRGTAILACLDDRVASHASLLGEVMPWTQDLPRIEADFPELVLPQGVGVNIHFTTGHEQELDMIAAAGFKCVRMDFVWGSDKFWRGIEDKKGKYDWSAYDELTTNLEKRGLRALYILDYSNPLYEETATLTHPRFGEYQATISPQHPESVAAFARWAGAAAKHFKNRRVIWEIWNEPNIEFWKPEPKVRQYITLALAACIAIREADPQATIIAPATSRVPLPFLEAVFKAGLLEYLDGVSVHPYRTQPPEMAAEDYAKLRELIERYAPAGKKNKIPIISGEWGYSTPAKGLSPEVQAAFLVRQQLANLLEGIPLSIWYDWKNDGANPNDHEHNFGTVEHDLWPKPAYFAVQKMVRELSGYRVLRRMPVASDQDFVLVTENATGQQKLAAWTLGETHTITLDGGPSVELAAMPKYLAIPKAE